MTPGYHRHYRIIDTDFHIGFSSPDLAHPLDHLLSGFRTSAPVDNALHYAICQKSDRALIVQSPDGESCQYPDLDSALPEIEIAMIHRGIAQMPYIGLHAGAVSWNDKTVLFPGASGRGKTTLSLGCALMGAHFLSDEIAVLNPQSGWIRAFPRTLCVKNQSLPIFDPLDQSCRLAASGAIRAIAGTQCVRADVLKTIPPDTWRPIHAIVFPRFSLDARTKLSALTGAEAIARLLKATMNRNRYPEQSFDILTKLATSAPCFTLRTGNLSDAVAQIQTLCMEIP